ncbi:exodeoxyribonuclease V subunit beta [Methylophaga thalassica]|uniref:exodeoxyribonuclease V subunit beta n=1 Tax=Methylophaga thalassica TaxID=40223 RepID=UPI002E7C46C8|nr:exodeoxyribonuclease V subunit beta [Methylophaga thalassica]WVI84639.1 exodeoxyribonuclease V subunit beta [Methylophaga thalassica]
MSAQFNVDTVALKGINLIEASAGTGKTFTLAELYCRLVVEQKLEVNQILVVTYTRAATEELRGRLRARLVDERKQLSQQAQADPQAIKRLQLAIQSFDEAAIYTIHGFCQRALQDFAFESGHFFDMEMVADEQELKQAVADDFWRRYVSSADNAFARYLLQKRQSPEVLLQSVSSLIGKPYLEVIPLPEMAVEPLQALYDKQFEHVQSLWWQQRDEAIAVLQDKNVLNGNKYRAASVSGWIAEMDSLMQAGKQAGLFEKFAKFGQAELTQALKKGQELPELSLWRACDALLDTDQQLQTARSLQLQQLRQLLSEYLATELPKRKQQLKLQAFDDLLLNLQQALHGTQADKLIAKIREQFQAALIDEFQDTDPIQYDCFHTIFANTEQPVFFVGDPKQAIYSFRGADIFTYLKAKHAAGNEFNLDTNWRSHPRLVKAVNHLFERVPQPFLYDDIPFYPVKAARADEACLTVSGQAVSPLSWVWMSSDTPFNVSDMMQNAANVTADQIATLLNQSASDEVMLTDKDGRQRQLNGGDIAVLVRSHKQATTIQQTLRARGVNSVQQSRDSVFETPQAVMLERVLMAIAQPSNDSLIATALATPLFAKSALDIYQAQQDEQQWLKQTDFFVSLHEQWQQAGFIVMFRALLAALDVQRHWLALADGERQLTNLLHLAELIQAHATRRNNTMEAILMWLASQRQSADKSGDAAQIRLESDEQLVKVITIHTSKGLEYPIVFCPFLWHQSQFNQQPTVMTFHRADDNQACVAFGEPGFSEAQPIMAEEQQAEDLRLLYVALTRAREQCVIVWAPVKNVQQSALFQLLHPELEHVDAGEMQQSLQQMVASQQDNMNVITWDADVPPVVKQADVSAQTLQARLFAGQIQTPWHIGSFTGLSHGQHIELPDHDAPLLPVDMPSSEQRQDRFGFPKGANAGTCLHSLFEHWDFQQQNEELTSLVDKTLSQFGIDNEWSTVVSSWLDAVVSTKLNQQTGLTLRDIQPQQRLDEMAFFFPVRQLTAKRLKQTLMPFVDDYPILSPVVKSLQFVDLSGFMKGFIDLVFEHEGRFYIADYKSNWLGTQADNYRQAALDEAMVAHSYPLQYLIYSLALHRYLQTRLPDYDPKQHFGGVYYLFIRGMHPDWGQAGVYFERPSTALLEALDRCMSEVDDV